MPEKGSSGPLRGNSCPSEAVCIHTRKVYDSCKEKECLQDIRVHLTCRSQELLENSISVKAKSAELLWVNIDVEPITFNRGFYTVDTKYFYRIIAEACGTSGRPREIQGVATYSKRTILFGSEGNAHIFSSQMQCDNSDTQRAEQNNLPIAVIEVVDPVVLGAKVQEAKCCDCECGCCSMDIPHHVCDCFDDALAVNDDGKQLLITLGQFSIMRLERDIQLLMPAYDVCLPEKECVNNVEDPCELFQGFRFPVDEFYPPKATEFTQMLSSSGNCCQGNHTHGNRYLRRR